MSLDVADPAVTAQVRRESHRQEGSHSDGGLSFAGAPDPTPREPHAANPGVGFPISSAGPLHTPIGHELGEKAWNILVGGSDSATETSTNPGPAEGNPIEIVADDRERESGVIEQLTNRPDIRVSVQRLELGDYLLNNRILVERKTLADLAVSIIDGRIFSQACRMVGGSFRPVLIIEGDTKGEAESGITHEALQGAMISLTVFLGIPYLRSRDPGETAGLMRFMAGQLARNTNRPVYRHGYRPKRTHKRRLFILQGLPGVGPTRAERLLETLGSVEAVFSASVDELCRVPGLGRATAENIRKLLARDPADQSVPKATVSSQSRAPPP